MNWSYIAGFFDGEGCIYWMKRAGVRRPVLCVGQAKANKKPILELVKFLNARRIRHKTYWQDRSAVSAQPFLRINIHEHRAVATFLRGMLPYMILKAKKARIALSFIDGRKWLHRPSEEEYRAAHALYTEGASSRDVSRVFKISPRALRSHWQQLGLSVRSQRDGAGIWRDHKSLSGKSRQFGNSK